MERMGLLVKCGVRMVKRKKTIRWGEEVEATNGGGGRVGGCGLFGCGAEGAVSKLIPLTPTQNPTNRAIPDWTTGKVVLSRPQVPNSLPPTIFL